MNKKRIIFCISVGMFFCAHVQAMNTPSQGAGELRKEQGVEGSQQCVRSTAWWAGWYGRCLARQEDPNRSRLGGVACSGVNWWGNGRGVCRVDEERAAQAENAEPIAITKGPDTPVVQEVVIEQPKVVLDNRSAVSQLPDGHVLKIDLSQPYAIPHDVRPGDKACEGIDWLKWYSGKHDGNAGIEKWAKQCEARNRLREKFQEAVRTHALNDQKGSAWELAGYDKSIAAVSFYIMQRLGRESGLTGPSPFKASLGRVLQKDFEGDNQDIGEIACRSWQSLHEQMMMGLQSVNESDCVEINAGIEICRERQKDREKPSRDQWSRNVDNRVDGRLAYALSNFLERANICQYAKRRGYALNMQEPIAPEKESSAVIDFLSRYQKMNYDAALGNEACNGLRRLSEMLVEAGASSALYNHAHAGIAKCDVRERYWMPNLQRSEGQERQKYEDTMLVADAALAQVSSDVFAQWQEGQGWRSSRMSRKSAIVAEAFQALCDGKPASSIAYDAQLGDEICKGSTDYRCVMRRRVLASPEGQKAVAEKHPEMLRVLRKLDDEIALYVYEKVRSGECKVYTQDRLRGFCLGNL